MHRFIPLCLLTIASTAIAQPTNRHVNFRGFDAIDLASYDTVHIVPGAAFSVSAGGDPRAVASLAMDVRNGTLRVGRTPGEHDDRGAVVTIAMPALRTMTLSGAGAIDASGAGGELVTARLSGSGQIRLPNLHAHVARLLLDGSGSITVSGRADRVGINLGGSGRVDASALATSNLSIDLGGSGTASAVASGAASIKAGGSGDVRVTGHPKCAVTKSGTARVICG